MGQIIGFEKNAEGDMVPQRQGWYCVQCKTWQKAVWRERKVLDVAYAEKSLSTGFGLYQSV